MAEEDEAAKLLASLGISAGGGGAKKAKPKKKKPAAAAAADAEADGEEQPPAADAEAGDDADGGDDEPAAASSGAAKKKKKKPAAKAEEKKEAAPPKLSKIAQLAQEAQARAQREREERERQEAEIRRQEEEAEREEQERAKKEAEEKELRRKKREEKKERLLAEGKPVTKAEKERARKLAERRAQLLAMGVVPNAEKSEEDKEREKAEKKERKEREKQEKEKKKKAKEAAAAPAETPTVVKEPEPVAPAPKVEKDWDEESDDETITQQLQSRVMKVVEADEVVVIDEVQAQVASAASSKSTTSKEKKEKYTAKAVKAKQQQEKQKGKAAARKRKESESSSESSDYSDSDSDSDSDYSDSEDDALRERIEVAREARLNRIKKSRDEARKSGILRSAICCVLGHVDTGKTKTLDMLRKTNVQEGEAGGITQQIGATFFPIENMKMVTDRLPEKERIPLKIPGLLVIDTPGHEAFSNLRSRGSGLADVAILVIDIMHGLEQQTIESIQLLMKRNTKFVIALNKIDRLYQWKVHPGSPVRQSLETQPRSTRDEFDTRVKNVITQLMEQGLNAKLYWENDSPLDTVSICPTSALTGEGSPDLINNLVKVAQEQMFNRLAYSTELECTVLEVKKIEGLGTTIDVCLVNGELHDDDTLVLATASGPIVTPVRSLLTPQPMKEMRVKGDYILHKAMKGAMGIKITCQAELENVVAGTAVFKVTPEDDIEELKEAVMKDVADNLKDIATVPRGVFVQASTLGSLEALMVHLKKEKIPVGGVGVGPIRKKDVTRASAMLENKQGDPDLFEREYATILAFNVKVDPAAQELAEELGVKIFTAEIVYHLADNYHKYAKEMLQERKKKALEKAVFPCIVKIIPGNVFNSKNPIVIGVDVVRGCVVEGTPLVVPEKLVDDPDNPGQKKMLEIGRVIGIEKDRVKVEKAVRGERVCIKIQGSDGNIQVGRHFEEKNQLVSKISRKSIDVLKSLFKEDIDALKEEGWAFIQLELKKIFKIQ